jgi:MarR family transcriptional regulator, temperature-dependent positive regulator of motility
MQKTIPKETSWLNQSPTHLVHRVAQCVSDIFSAEAKDTDLTPRQVAILSTVGENEGLSQTGIVARTGIDRSTVAEVVSRLKKKKLLERRRTRRDARAYSVTLTDEGRRVLRTIEPLAKKVDEHILAAVPPKDRAPFLAALLSIVATLQPPE